MSTHKLRKFPHEAFNIIGLPPAIYHDPDTLPLVLNSMPVLEITPGLPRYGSGKGENKGIKLFSFDSEEGIRQYNNIFHSSGLGSTPTFPMKVAFLNDAPLTETFSNEYGESMFEQAANFGLPFAAELQYLSGKQTVGEALGEIAKNYKGDKNAEINVGGKTVGEKASNIAKTAANLSEIMSGTVLSGLSTAANTVESLAKNMFPGYGSEVIKLLSGHNLDFPMIWRGASYTPTYSITVRLVNPFSSDDDVAHEKFIVEPLMKLLVFIMPITTSTSTFNYPLICKVECPGMFKIKSGFISNIDVIKGGEVNNIGFNQRLSQVDIRITFGDMYNTMVSQIGESNLADEDRPTLRDYLNNIRNAALVDTDWRKSPNTSGHTISSVDPIDPPTVITQANNRDDIGLEPGNRVSSNNTTIADKLVNYGA